jgi:hypothetical protein
MCPSNYQCASALYVLKPNYTSVACAGSTCVDRDCCRDQCANIVCDTGFTRIVISIVLAFHAQTLNAAHNKLNVPRPIHAPEVRVMCESPVPLTAQDLRALMRNAVALVDATIVVLNSVAHVQLVQN